MSAVDPALLPPLPDTLGSAFPPSVTAGTVKALWWSELDRAEEDLTWSHWQRYRTAADNYHAPRPAKYQSEPAWCTHAWSRGDRETVAVCRSCRQDELDRLLANRERLLVAYGMEFSMDHQDELAAELDAILLRHPVSKLLPRIYNKTRAADWAARPPALPDGRTSVLLTGGGPESETDSIAEPNRWYAERARWRRLSEKIVPKAVAKARSLGLPAYGWNVDLEETETTEVVQDLIAAAWTAIASADHESGEGSVNDGLAIKIADDAMTDWLRRERFIFRQEQYDDWRVEAALSAIQDRWTKQRVAGSDVVPQGRRPALSLDEVLDGGDDGEGASLVDALGVPDECLEDVEDECEQAARWDAFLIVQRRLDDRDRADLLLVLEEGVDITKMAARWNCTASTARGRLRLLTDKTARRMGVAQQTGERAGAVQARPPPMKPVT